MAEPRFETVVEALPLALLPPCFETV